MKQIFLQLKPILEVVYHYTINHPETLVKVLLVWFTLCGIMEWINRFKKKRNFFDIVWKAVMVIFFIGCLVMLLYVTLGNRHSSGEEKYRFDLFWSYKEVIYHNNMFILWQIIWNIVAFIPIGNVIFYLLGKKRKFYKVILYMGAFSLGIEATQLQFKMGLFEFDDVLHNTLGAVIGYLIAGFFSIVGSFFAYIFCKCKKYVSRKCGNGTELVQKR